MKVTASRNAREGYYIGNYGKEYLRMSKEGIRRCANLLCNEIDLRPMLKSRMRWYIRNNILPEGVHQISEFEYEAMCVSCENYTRIYCDISEVPMDDYIHYCSGSPRCCP